MRATLYRDHPAEGWLSMDRYAEGLLPAISAVLPPPWEARMPMPPSPWPGRYGQLLVRLLRYPAWARRQRGDVNHILDQSYAHLLLALDPARTIITVHDVAPLHFPGRRCGPFELAWRWAWRALRRAQHIIVDTDFIADELRTLLPHPPERFHVIPHAVAPHFRPEPAERTVAARGRVGACGEWVLLHVGSLQPRKNVPTLLRALATLRDRGVPAKLVQVGGHPSARQRALLVELGVEGAVQFVGRLSETELVAAYNAADVFVLPSLYEGFGLPVLEAMACGTPVVCASASSLPDVAGDAALLVAPEDPDTLAEALESLLTDATRRGAMRERGLERARQFTWARYAAATFAVYKEVCGLLH